MNKEQELKDLTQARDRVTTGFFWLGLKIAIIFGIPAFWAAFLGKRLDLAQGGGFTWRIAFLVIAFFLSWTIVYFEYKKLSKKLQKFDKDIKTLKEDLEKENA